MLTFLREFNVPVEVFVDARNTVSPDLNARRQPCAIDVLLLLHNDVELLLFIEFEILDVNEWDGTHVADIIDDRLDAGESDPFVDVS